MAQSWFQLPAQWNRMVADSPDSVLLATSRCDAGNRRSFLFLDPVQTLSATTLDQIPKLFCLMEEALAQGLYVAGFISYECGYHFQSLEKIAPGLPELPLAWFGTYRDPLIFDHETGRMNNVPLVSTGDFKGVPDCLLGNADLSISHDEYCEKVRKIQDYIGSGDTYQVNFTDRINVETSARPAEVFALLSRRQPVPYGAFLHAAGHHILSLSPELFFRVDDSRIATRPMKGTMPRGLDALDDIEAAARLQNDEKNRAEHIMIVDLLRNDLGRICAMGSVQVEQLFTVEKYRTLLQMTSTVSGTLKPGVGYYEIFRSMFPGGSVTGAPKIRTMEIIRELEKEPRGVYTGAIGFLAPNRTSVFNVSIRTLVLKSGRGSMGVGGGIVADSRPEAEHRECLLKASFLTRQEPRFQLLETMLWDGEFALLSMHLDRMESSAGYFEFPFDRAAILTQLIEHADRFQTGDRYRVRLLLDRTGEATIASAPYVQERSTGYVRISSERTSSGDVFLRHKTTCRELYDRIYREACTNGFDEVLFLNEKGEVTEGAISNLFVLRGDRLLTPPLRCGVLPGIFRRRLLETHPKAEECILTVQDLECADEMFLCNSVRGMHPVKYLCLNAPLKEVCTFQ